MAIWIQSLSWALICALGQGIIVYLSLRLILKLVPASSANARYHLSLSALTVLLVWFAATWWRQFHLLAQIYDDASASHIADTAIIALPQVAATGYMSRVQAYITSLQFLFPWLSGLYMAGLTIMLVRLSAGMRQLFSYKHSGTTQPGDALNQQFAALKQRISWHAPVQLLVSAKAHVPMVIGFLKPVILLPAATMAQLTTEQVETILLHELAHLKRYDYIINVLQTVVETILFFNPFVWLISSTVRQEREHSCDDMVLKHTQEPILYATALAAVASYGRTGYPAMVIAASGERTHLFNRIRRIMELKKSPFSYSRMAAAILIVAAITCSVAWLKPVSGQLEDEAPEMICVKPSSITNLSEENQLVGLLLNDHIVDQVKGFIVEKNHDKLYIDGKQQTDEMAEKYFSAIKKEYIRVQVYPFAQRLYMHPGAGFLQVLLPVSNSSQCIDYKSSKPGC